MKKKGWYALIGGCWPGAVTGGLTRNGAHTMGVLGVNVWLCLVGPELEEGTKIREVVSY